MRERSAGITRAVRGGGGGGTPLSAPRLPFAAAASRSGTLARRGSPQEREPVSGFLVKPLLFFVFPKRCMLTRTSLFIFPSASSSFPSFSLGPREWLRLYLVFGYPPSFPSTYNLVTPALRNSPPLPEGQRNKNWHKMSCERSSWKVFLQKIRGTREGLPLGTRTFSHLQNSLKPKKTHH